jgi:ligand-binding sensor domain-containing protein
MKTRLPIILLIFFTFDGVQPLCAQWVQAHGPYYDPGSPLAADSNGIFVAYFGGQISHSSDNGLTWKTFGNASPIVSKVNSLTISGAKLFAGTMRGLYSSNDSGVTWTPFNTGLPSPLSIQSVIVSPDSSGNILAGTNHGVLLSSNNGSSWSTVNFGLADSVVNCLSFNGTRLFAGTSGGLFYSTNKGLNWFPANNGIGSSNIVSIAANGPNIYAGTDSGVFRSTDNGASWGAAGLSGVFIQALAVTDARIYAGTNTGLFLTTNDGSTWINGNLSTNVFYIVVENNNIFVSGTGGIFLSTDAGSSWKCLTGQTSGAQYTFASRDTCLFVGTWYGVFLSTDNGESWMPAGLPNISIGTLVFNGSSLFAGTSRYLFVSTNNGVNWDTITTLHGFYLTSFIVNRQKLYATTYEDSASVSNVYASNDDGTSWVPVGSGPGVTVSGLLPDPDSANIIYAWTSYNGVFKSTDGGASWNSINSGLSDSSITTLSLVGRDLYAGTLKGAFSSTNGGGSWAGYNSNLGNTNINVLATDSTLPGRLFAGTYYGGVFMNAGSFMWTNISQGLPDVDVSALSICGTNLVAGTNGSNVWYRPLSQVITNVISTGNSGPTSFKLSQNYPNPFNPSTTISYQLPTSRLVVLKVFDVLGREVETLVNERQTAGTHAVKFNAANLPSGVYFCRLQAGTYHETKKLLLLK